ncbi:hypothetical protein ACT3JT_07580 [Escherichia coli]|nr:hypothetical protein [Escherichia coli]MED9157196.1 hypothetical protein [Escherichia coli]MED9541790.1 hypothetical protein [Escherichia coli]OMI43225.1 hypothetical protein MP33_16690 [Escherichia coli N37058PS]SQK26359.1 Uncharacterised protein [Escherichia coli]SQM12575.1 Uncharacterised protein [Escherichia coli]
MTRKQTDNKPLLPENKSAGFLPEKVLHELKFRQRKKSKETDKE